MVEVSFPPLVVEISSNDPVEVVESVVDFSLLSLAMSNPTVVA